MKFPTSDELEGMNKLLREKTLNDVAHAIASELKIDLVTVYSDREDFKEYSKDEIRHIIIYTYLKTLAAQKNEAGVEQKEPFKHENATWSKFVNKMVDQLPGIKIVDKGVDRSAIDLDSYELNHALCAFKNLGMKQVGKQQGKVIMFRSKANDLDVMLMLEDGIILGCF